jgi:hypothetical protein
MPFFAQGRDIDQCRAACGNKNEGNMSALCGPRTPILFTFMTACLPNRSVTMANEEKYPSMDVIFLTLVGVRRAAFS